MDYNHVIENVGKVIDAAGVAVIVVGTLISTGAAVVELSRHQAGVYRHFRQQLGRTILLGLESSLEVELTGYWPWQRKTAQLPPE